MPTKRALLIGINYVGTGGELNGCWNDVSSIRDLLKTKAGYLPENITTLTDMSITPANSIPTRQNILNAISNFVSKAQSGDYLFFHYSGHGSWVSDRPDTKGKYEESDCRDECICPLDSMELGKKAFLKDDLLRQALVNPLPSGVSLVCIFDSCHSGTILDLPHCDFPRPRDETQYEEPQCKVICFTGCLDKQTSADAWMSDSSRYEGACSWAFARCWAPERTYLEVSQEMNALLKKAGYAQTTSLWYGGKWGDTGILKRLTRLSAEL